MTTVLQIIPELNTGGAELSTLEMTQAIIAAGGRPLVATQGGRMASEIEAIGGEIIPLPLASKNPFRLWKNTQALAELIRQEHINLVHARSRAPAWSARWACQKTKTPFVTTYHGAYSNKGLFKNYYNSVMARGDVVIANSEFTAHLIRTQHKAIIEEDRLRVVHRGVDMDLYDRNAISQDRIENLKAQWDIKQGDTVVLNAARLTRWKGQHTLIEAVAKLVSLRNYDQLVFILAGDAQGRSDYLTSLQIKIKDAGLEKVVRLVGHCDDVAAAFALANLSIVASTKPEAFGRAAVESQALECPVIVTEIGATAETVLCETCVDETRSTGWRIPPNNSDALCQTLKRALERDSAQLRDMGRRGRAHVMKNFTLKLMQYKTLKVYDDLLQTNFAQTFAAKYEFNA